MKKLLSMLILFAFVLGAGSAFSTPKSKKAVKPTKVAVMTKKVVKHPALADKKAAKASKKATKKTEKKAAKKMVKKSTKKAAKKK